ncbi:MAG: hypothetical protein HY655_12470 [Acidobacteria bacterium]|nr:hypothetical protein [Acidobacteriota bacterium]
MIMRSPAAYGTRNTANWLAPLFGTVAFSGLIAAVPLALGTSDLESYEQAWFSMDRGTAVQTVRILGHPVYTLAIGLGARLPLLPNLGASPAAFLAPYLPAPWTYWLLMTCAIAMAAFTVRHALEPLCGRIVSWLALVLLFCSAPMVNYTLTDDWIETAVAYCGFVACVFSPHAILSLCGTHRPSAGRHLHGTAIRRHLKRASRRAVWHAIECCPGSAWHSGPANRVGCASRSTRPWTSPMRAIFS